MQNSKIEWCDHTFNPWYGCTKVSPACDNCFAEMTAKRWPNTFGHAQWGNYPRVLSSAASWQTPYTWNRKAEKEGKRIKVFCGSMCDVFDNSVPDKWRMDLFSLISKTPHLDWLLLTKRIGNVGKMMQHDGLMFDMLCDGNCWLGITVCNQDEANRDIPKLLSIPAYKYFLSIEPMLGQIDIAKWLVSQCDNGSIPLGSYTGKMCGLCQGMGPSCSGINWIIVGGESGQKTRPIHPKWVRSIRDQCKAAGIPFFFKQWGEHIPYEWHAQSPYLYSQHGDLFDGHGLPDFDSDDPKEGWVSDDTNMVFYRRIGTKKSGCLLDGHEYKEFPHE